MIAGIHIEKMIVDESSGVNAAGFGLLVEASLRTLLERNGPTPLTADRQTSEMIVELPAGAPADGGRASAEAVARAIFRALGGRE
jgi:hypothetical protein